MLQRQTREKINEWVVWFNWHADKVDSYPLEQKMRWMLKAINGAYEVMTLLANEQNARPTGSYNTTNGGLLVPRSWRFEGRRG